MYVYRQLSASFESCVHTSESTPVHFITRLALFFFETPTARQHTNTSKHVSAHISVEAFYLMKQTACVYSMCACEYSRDVPSLEARVAAAAAERRGRDRSPLPRVL